MTHFKHLLMAYKLLTQLQDKAVHGNGAQLSCSREVDPDLESDLDPLDPKFLARIHDPHQR